MLRLACVAVALSTVAMPGTGWAKCASPLPFISPMPGAEVPPNPVLYFFALSSSDKLPLTFIDGKGAQVHATAEKLNGTSVSSVFRVQVHAAADTTFVLANAKGEAPPDARPWRVVATWTRPAAATPELRAKDETNFSWACSWHETRSFSVDQRADAYRVEWAASEAEYRKGNRSAFVVPTRMDRFFKGWSDESAADSTGELQLGHVNCTGFTFSWTESPIFIGVAALHSDGSEDVAPRAPVRVDPPTKAKGRR